MTAIDASKKPSKRQIKKQLRLEKNQKKKERPILKPRDIYDAVLTYNENLLKPQRIPIVTNNCFDSIIKTIKTTMNCNKASITEETRKNLPKFQFIKKIILCHREKMPMKCTSNFTSAGGKILILPI